MKEVIIQEDIDITNDITDTSKIDLPDMPLNIQPLKRSNISKKNPFIKPYVYRNPLQDREIKQKESTKLILKTFQVYMKELEKLNNERQKQHAKWLFYLRSDETSEDGTP